MGLKNKADLTEDLSSNLEEGKVEKVKTMESSIKSSDDISKAQGYTKASSILPSKNFWKKAINLALYLVACLTAGTGLLLAYRLPHGAGNAGRFGFLGYGRHEWGDIHTWLAFFGLLLVVVHLALNWPWLVKVAASKHFGKLAAGILSGLLIIIAFVLLPVERSERNRESDTIHTEIKR